VPDAVAYDEAVDPRETPDAPGAGLPGPDDAGIGLPAGDVYDWFRRGCQLLDDGHPAAAVELLTRVAATEPSARHVRETLGRARLAAGRFADAEADFAALVASQPDDDYAQLGLGLALARQGRFGEAAEHLALAAAMRPDREEYVTHLRQVRATLRAQAEEDQRLA
jgi:Flp pilus assembly protein TadD